MADDRPAPARVLPSLTGMRWFAALAVFGVHLGTVGGSFMTILSAGPAGVSFFYVLSGFVLTWSASTGPRDTALRFYVRRFARVYPAYLATWLLVLLLVPSGIYHYGARPFFLGAGLLQAWSPQRNDYYGGNGVGWSLSCEAFFYLLFPLMYRALRAMPVRRLALVGTTTFGAIAALDVAAAVFGSHAQIHAATSEWIWVAYILPPVRFLEFVIGAVAALLLIRRDGRCPVPAWLALGGALGAYLLTLLAVDVRVAVAVTVLPFALVICAFAAVDARGGRSWLAARPLVVLGRWSFAFYLIHQPVIMVVRHIAAWGTPPPGRLVIAIACLAAALCVAALLHLLIERPAERRIRASIQGGPSTFRPPLPVSG